MNRTDLLETMRDGFESLDSYLLTHPLPESSKMFVKDLVEGIGHYRQYRNLSRGVLEPARTQVSTGGKRPARLRARGTRSAEVPGEHYLDAEERKRFETDGILGPYNLMSRAEAGRLYRYVKELHERRFDGQLYISDESIAALEAGNLWTLDYSGWYQHLNFQPLWDVLASPEIAQRIASLLGDDLLCWRSQFFEKGPGERGSFWHQTDTFRETSQTAKLVPTRADSEGLVQLTAWIALTDATIENGCLRMLPGSFADNRLEAFTYDVAANKIDHFYELSEEDLERMLSALLFGHIFEKSQVLFELATRRYPDLFEGRSVRDLEMKAGDFVLFSSMNVHGSYSNTTPDPRLALVGRYTNDHVRVMPGWTTDVVQTPAGYHEYPLDRIGCIQVHGRDHCGWNRIIEYRW